MHIDSASRWSLQLWTCTGGVNGGFVRRPRGGPFEYCHHATHEPLREVGVSADGRALAFNETRHGVQLGPTQRPVFVHSNGYHFKLTDATFAPLLRRLGVRADRFKLVQDAKRLPRALLERTAVLLVESWGFGLQFSPCSVCSLGWLINASQFPEGAPGRFRSGRVGRWREGASAT